MAVNFRKVQFLTSAPSLQHLPADSGFEVAFCGRSNAGKSSTLNAVTGCKVARTSRTPGRTQMINLFSLDDESYRLVDLPGYGYAKAPKRARADWQQLLADYLNRRQSLCGLILLTDSRHALQPSDQQLLAWSQKSRLPVHLLLNKADKLKFAAAQSTLKRVRQQLDQQQLLAPISVQLFSALKREGLQTLQDQIIDWLNP